MGFQACGEAGKWLKYDVRIEINIDTDKDGLGICIGIGIDTGR